MSMIGNFLAISPDRLADLIKEPALIESLLYPEDGPDPEKHLDIDKSWHAIHYVLNGSTWEGEGPLALAVLGGEEIGEDIGYGPARYLDTDQVKAVAASLSFISAQEFSAKFNLAALDAAEIYPQGWNDVPPVLSSTAIWSPIPPDQEIGREEALFRRTDHRLPA